MKQSGLLPSRGLAAVPVLMLPVTLGALWLAVAPGTVPARVLVIGGTVAVAWYLLGGILAGRRLLHELAVRRQIRAVRSSLAEQAGCAWAIDAEGAVRAQSAMAEQLLEAFARHHDVPIEVEHSEGERQGLEGEGNERMHGGLGDVSTYAFLLCRVIP